MLKRANLEQVKRHKRRLFAVSELSFDQAKMRKMVINCDQTQEDKNNQNTDNKNIDIILSLPF